MTVLDKPWVSGIVTPTIQTINATTMRLTSIFAANESIPSIFTCDAANVNPPLTITDVPLTAQSLALIVDDPDAPAGTWTHWVLWNIAPTTKEIKQNTVPEGAVQGVTSFGKSGWGGPCPPSGTHHYHFKLYALNVADLGLPPSATVSQVVAAVNKRVIAQTDLVGLYKRSK